MKTNKLLVAALVVQAGIIIGLWYGPRPSKPSPNPRRRRQTIQLIQLQTDTNAKLDKIIGILDGGDLKVTVSKADDK